MGRYDKWKPPLSAPPEVRRMLAKGWGANEEHNRVRVEWVTRARHLGYLDREIAAAIGIGKNALGEFMRKHDVGRNQFNHSQKNK